MNNQILNSELLNEKVRIKKQIEELQGDLEAIDRVLKMYIPKEENHSKNISIEINTSANDEMPTGYDRNWRQEDKVLWLLKKMNGAFATDIGASIHKYEPEIPAERANAIATIYLSKLNKEGKLKYEKYGKKFKYFSI